MADRLSSGGIDRPFMGCLEKRGARLCIDRARLGRGLCSDCLILPMGCLGRIATRGSYSSDLLLYWTLFAARYSDCHRRLARVFPAHFLFNCWNQVHPDASACRLKPVGWSPPYPPADGCR